MTLSPEDGIILAPSFRKVSVPVWSQILVTNSVNSGLLDGRQEADLDRPKLTG